MSRLLHAMLRAGGGKGSYGLSNISFGSRVASVADFASQDIEINDYGRFVYLAQNGTTDAVHRHLMSTWWNMSTCSASLNDYYDISGTISIFGAFHIPDGGEQLFAAQSNTIDRFTMPTAYLPSTASHDSGQTLTLNGSGAASGLVMSPDKTVAIVADDILDKIHRYTMSTGGDLTIGSYDSGGDITISGATNFNGLAGSPDGKHLIAHALASGTTPTLYHIEMTTPWDTGTGTVTESLDTTLLPTHQPITIRGLKYHKDGGSIYFIGVETGTTYIYQYYL